jgi:hypothetical protein
MGRRIQGCAIVEQRKRQCDISIFGARNGLNQDEQEALWERRSDLSYVQWKANWVSQALLVNYFSGCPFPDTCGFAHMSGCTLEVMVLIVIAEQQEPILAHFHVHAQVCKCTVS